MPALAIALLVPLGAELRAGKDADPGLLTLDRIFQSSDFQGQPPPAIHWLPGQRGYTTRVPASDAKGASDLVRVDPASGQQVTLVSGRHLIPAGASAPLAIEDYAWSKNESHLLIYTNSKRVWRRNTRGDYWVFDTGSRELRKLGGEAPPSSLMFAKFSPDGRKVAYVRDRNLYVEDLTTHRITPLTRTDSAHVLNGIFDWVYEEELGLFDGFRWSPDSKQIAFWQLDTSGTDDYYLVNNTAGLYQQLTKFKYPKAGRPNSACRIGVVAVEPAQPADGPAPNVSGFAPGHAARWLHVPGDPREHYIARMDWAGDAQTVQLQQRNRLQNTNTVFLADAQTGHVEPVLVEKDKAWVDVAEHLEWIEGASKFTWLSERDGWRRLYVVSRSGKDLKAITPPGADVIGVARVDEKNGWVYYYASPDNATQKYLYRVRLDGGSAQPVSPTAQRGTHTYNISPDAAWAVHTFSTFDTPPVTDLVALPEHKSVRVLAESKKLQQTIKALKRQPTEFFRIDIGDGVELDGWCMKPPDFDPAKRYPVLFHVYGEPAGQTVLDRWGGQTYLWHLLLAQKGYLVMSVDNRGTPAPRGRDWRKIIYRQVGILAPKEQAAAVSAILKRWPFVDPERVGIWGWSGGGSMSLNAIFRYPDLYHTAMAVAPVSNQRYYDTIYQERYMGLPEDNPDGYRDGSPITHAHKLKGNLLIVHGTADDNVHYANAEALVNELVAANKQFTMMAYPNRSHGIAEGTNTRRHLFGLLTRYLEQNLPPGPKGP
jgi:dipeptidyl-peptidase-4